VGRKVGACGEVQRRGDECLKWLWSDLWDCFERLFGLGFGSDWIRLDWTDWTETGLDCIGLDWFGFSVKC